VRTYQRDIDDNLMSAAFHPRPDEYRPGVGSVAAMIQWFAYICFRKLGSISIS
jgi:hypothetical protein